MVDKVNGNVQQGFFFEKDVCTVSVTATGGDFVDDINGVNPPQSNALDDIVELLSAYGTVIGVSVAGAGEVHFMLGYAQQLLTDGDALGGSAATTIETDLETAINAIDLSGEIPAGPNLSAAAVTIFSGFRGGNNT